MVRHNCNYQTINYLGRPLKEAYTLCASGPFAPEKELVIPIDGDGPDMHTGIMYPQRLPVGTSCDDIHVNWPASYFDDQSYARELENTMRTFCSGITKNPVVGYRHNCAWKGDKKRVTDYTVQWTCSDGPDCDERTDYVPHHVVVDPHGPELNPYGR
jgi:hypothetical protein